MNQTNDHFAALETILALYPGEARLAAPPTFDRAVASRAEAALARVEEEIGAAKDGDYFKTCRERFLHSLMLALRYVKPHGRILDVGNAPGYLARGLSHLGYDVTGINLNAEYIETYPSRSWVELFSVREIDIEQQPLPYDNGAYDGVIFTEVLEHIAITHPKKILVELTRILAKDGWLIFSTPNVCNISNVIALLTGLNIFWAPEIFYGSRDRHNREYTPGEVLTLFEDAGLAHAEFYGMNDHANWRSGANDATYEFLSRTHVLHPMLRNTIVGVFRARA